MAKLVQRVGDANTGGGIILAGDPTVLVNGRPIATIFAPVSPHPPCGAKGQQAHCNAHTQLKPGAVLVNGKPVSVSPGTDTCGHPRLTGSLNVVIGI